MQAAQVAAPSVAEHCRVEVIDSLTCSMGLGNLCIAAAKRATAGAPIEEIVAEVTSRRERTRLFGTLDTLEFLKKGGRIGNARALLGSMLAVKPVVEIRDGVVEEAGKVRTRSKALRLLADKVHERSVEDVAVLQGDASDIDEFLDLIDDVAPRDKIVVGAVGPVIGTHAGPGVLGVTYQVAD